MKPEHEATTRPAWWRRILLMLLLPFVAVITWVSMGIIFLPIILWSRAVRLYFWLRRC